MESGKSRKASTASKRTKKQQSQEAATAEQTVFPAQKRRSLYIVIDPKANTSTENKRLPAAPSVKKPLSLQQAPAVNHITGAAVKQKSPTTAMKKPPPIAAKPTFGALLKQRTATSAVMPAALAKNPPVPLGKNPPLSSKRVPAAAAAAGVLTGNKPTTSARKPLQPSTATTSIPRKYQLASAVKPHPTTAQRTTRPINLMTQPFDRTASVAKIVKPIRAGGAPGKFKSEAPQKSTKALGMSDHSRIIKVKKAPPTHNKQRLMDRMPNLKQELLQIATEDPLPDTPIDAECVEIPFQAQATSTQCKRNSCSDNLLEAYRDLTNLSPVTITENSTGSTVKRQLIPQEAESKQKPKFNFVRYSEGFSVLNSPESPEEDTVIPSATAAGEQGIKYIFI